MTADEQKELLRRDLLKHRYGLIDDYVNSASQKIINNCIHLIPWERVRSVHTYVPIAEKNEVNTWFLLKYIWQYHPRVTTLVPVMNKQQMVSAEVSAKTNWRNNKFGIPEPIDTHISALFHQLDIIVVPTLGFDKSGNRLGYGQGHYDKFLKNQPNATTIGPAYSVSEIKPTLPAKPHDVKLDYVITENGVLEFRTKI